jgi:hypothetical protein
VSAYFANETTPIIVTIKPSPPTTLGYPKLPPGTGSGQLFGPSARAVVGPKRCGKLYLPSLVQSTLTLVVCYALIRRPSRESSVCPCW